MALSERLQFLLTVDAKGAVKGFQDVGKAADKELSKADQRLDKLGGNMQKAGAAAMAFAGVSAVALGKTVQAFQKQERAELLLQNTMANMPKLAGESADQFLELASAIQSKTVAADEDVISAMAMLGTFSLTAAEIKNVTPLVVDYARKFDIDLVSAATQVGKALDGQVGALKRNGVSIDEAMFKTDRFGAVVDALGNQVKGFAEAEAQTFNGQIQQMKNNLGDLAEGVGAGVVDVIGGAAKSLNGLTQQLNSVNPEITRTAGRFAAIGTAAIGTIGALSFVGGSIIKMRHNFTTLAADGTRSLNTLGKAAKGVGVAMGVAAVALAAYSLHQAQAARQAKEMADIQAKVIAGSKAEVEQYAKQLAAVINLRGGYDKFIDGNLDAAVAMLQAAEASDKTRAEFERQGISLDDMRAAVDKAAESQAEASRVQKDAQGIVSDLTGEFDDNADAMDDTAKAAADLERRTKALQKAMEDETKAVNDSVKAINDKRDAARRAADGVFNLRRAEDDLRSSVASANEVIKSGNTDLRAVRSAMDDATTAAARQADAVVDLKDDQASANGQTLTAQDRQNNWNAAMLKSAATLEGPLQQAVLDYIADVNKVPKGTITEVTARIDSRAFEDAERSLAWLSRNRQSTFTPSFSGRSGAPIQGRFVNAAGATGGIVTRPTLALIGEAGPEAVIPLNRTPGSSPLPTGNVAVLDKPQSAPSYTVNVTAGMGANGDDIGRQVVDAIKRYERSNGTRWRS